MFDIQRVPRVLCAGPHARDVIQESRISDRMDSKTLHGRFVKFLKI